MEDGELKPRDVESELERQEYVEIAVEENFDHDSPPVRGQEEEMVKYTLLRFRIVLRIYEITYRTEFGKLKNIVHELLEYENSPYEV